MLLLPTQISAYTTITGTVTQAYIDAAVRSVNLITSNYFVSDLCVETSAVFSGGAGGTITIQSNDWTTFGFATGDEIFIFGSYRNDGYKTVSTIATSVMTLLSTSTAISELSGPSIYFSVVQWPEELKSIVANLVAYDVDDRDKVAANVTSHSLGPFSESFGSGNTGDSNPFGYPAKLTAPLMAFRLASVR